MADYVADEAFESSSETCEKKRRKRSIITPYELIKLEALFKRDRWPSRRHKEYLAQEIGRPVEFVSIWLQNKRQRVKKELNDKESGTSDIFSKNDKDDTRRAEASSITTEKIPVTKNPLTGATEVPIILNAVTSSSSEVTVSTSSSPTGSSSDSTISVKLVRMHDGGYHRNTDQTPISNTKFADIDDTKMKDSLQVETPKQSIGPPSSWFLSANVIFHVMISMMALEEGGLIKPTDEDFDIAVKGKMYGIKLNDNRTLIYTKEYGFDLDSDDDSNDSRR